MDFEWMVKGAWERSDEAKVGLGVAQRLHEAIDYAAIESRVEAWRMGAPGRETSREIQALVALAAEPLGFSSERRGIFREMNLELRPDLFNAELGILLEVERGGANTNNHDLKDFWKCHLCPSAAWLFLALPERVHGGRPFSTTRRRFAQFFQPGNEVNVHGVALFGY